MDRREKLLHGLDLARSRGLEIGALCRPLIDRSRFDVRYVDYADTAFLRQRYASDPTVDVDAIVTVDYVWGERTLAEITEGRRFDYVIASHVIEHVPDLVTWLAEVSSVLEPGGTIRLAIPDRRYTFDRVRGDSTMAMVMDAYLRKARRPLLLPILDHLLNVVEIDARTAWDAPPPDAELRRLHTLEQAIQCATDSLDRDAYHDVHCWTFTPESFAALMAQLSGRGLLSLACDRFFVTDHGEDEFYVSLRHGRGRSDAADSWRAMHRQCTTTVADAAHGQSIATLQMRIDGLQRELDAIRASTSWRLTWPLRAAVAGARQAVRLAVAARTSARVRGGVIPMIRSALGDVREHGMAGYGAHLRGHATGRRNAPPQSARDRYAAWIAREAIADAQGRDGLASELATWEHPPTISILMPTYEPPAALLERAIASVTAQAYPHWELCIADDASPSPRVREAIAKAAAGEPRIRTVIRDTNGHISAASNSALALATGTFVALLDHDDELHPMALLWIARELRAHPDAGLVYTDEDKLDADGRRGDPYFKSDLNPELLLSHNMICHLGVYRRTLVESLGGFRTGFEGAQDYDLALRVIERLSPAQVRHVPKVLYHWRIHAGSTATGGEAKPYAWEAGRRALTEHLARTGESATVEAAPEAPNMYRVRFALPQPTPTVEIIVPTRDAAGLMRTCVGSLLERTDYPAFKICIVDNGSVEDETLALFDGWRRDPRFRILRDDRPFNYSALNNAAAAGSDADFLCLLNNDIEVVSRDWLAEMVSLAARPGVGCVGARLWYPDGTLQHGGVVLGLQGVAGHAHKHLPRGQAGYFGRAVLLQTLSAVTAACLVVRRETFQQVGGLDERLEVAFNDIDFCLRVRERGLRNIWTPYAELIHHESVSRGYEDNPVKQARFGREIETMQSRWRHALDHDPYYSPNLTRSAEDFSITPT